MTTLAEVAEQVAKGLATFETINGSAYISTPLLYPGGASVAVRIDAAGDRFIASDAGIGSREAHLLGGDRIYARAAGAAARRYGVSFDGVSMFTIDSPREELVFAVTAVANASKAAVEATAFRIAERAAGASRELLHIRLERLFGKHAETKKVTARGASNDEWEFDAAVRQEGRLILFEAINPHAGSVSSAVAKFVDIADMPEHPGLVGVLVDPSRTPHRRLIERSAVTIAMAAEDRAWQRAAA